MQIKQITLIEQLSIAIVMNEEWHHEQINVLAEHVLHKIPESRVLEHVYGGDREYIRFQLAQDVYHLQFEWYGQSIWIEHESEQVTLLIGELYDLMNKSVNEE